jgi:hypothetical protein
MPLENSHLIHPRWEEHFRPTADRQLTAECVLRRPAGPGVFDEAAGATVYPDPTVLYTGTARLQASSRLDSQEKVGDRQVTIHRYQVALPIAVADVAENDQLLITECSDAALLGHVMRVVDVPGGSLMWQRNLVAEDVIPITR